MNLHLTIPDDLAKKLLADGRDPARVVLEAFAVDGYRTHALSEYQVRLLLGFETRYEVHGFLKEHGVPLNYGVEELEHDLAVAHDIGAQLLAERGANKSYQP